MTDPAKIGNFQPEHIVAIQKSLNLNCEAEGNPPPTYTWTPCDPEQVCNKNTLHISQVINDTNYTCSVVNAHGLDSRTANICKSHVHCSHASNSCISIHIPTWHFDWVLRVEPGVSLSGCKSLSSAFTLSWWITLCFLLFIAMQCNTLILLLHVKYQESSAVIKLQVSYTGVSISSREKTIVRASD